MRILLTNDDGIYGEGLAILEEIAKKISDDIWVVAPETDQSGLAHSLTLSHPLRLRQIDDRHFALKGTPTDCVIMAVRHLMKDPPDLILSGINAGSNVADDVTYSGTVAGAMEGALLNIRSIALSQCYEMRDGKRHISWENAKKYGVKLIENLLKIDIEKNIIFNVNFPIYQENSKVLVKVTKQGKRVHNIKIDKRLDNRGFDYYWLNLGHIKEQSEEGTDLNAIAQNAISVTPLHLDLTAYEALSLINIACDEM